MIFSSPSSEVLQYTVLKLRKVMKYSNVVKFEVCSGCSYDSSVCALGFELAAKNGRRCIC